MIAVKTSIFRPLWRRGADMPSVRLYPLLRGLFYFSGSVRIRTASLLHRNILIYDTPKGGWIMEKTYIHHTHHLWTLAAVTIAAFALLLDGGCVPGPKVYYVPASGPRPQPRLQPAQLTRLDPVRLSSKGYCVIGCISVYYPAQAENGPAADQAVVALNALMFQSSAERGGDLVYVSPQDALEPVYEWHSKCEDERSYGTPRGYLWPECERYSYKEIDNLLFIRTTGTVLQKMPTGCPGTTPGPWFWTGWHHPVWDPGLQKCLPGRQHAER